jgi:probable rRNA maturation factor
MAQGDYRIEIANSQDCVQIDEAFLQEVVARTLAEEGVCWAQISLAIVDDPTIHELNRRHLDHDEPTDVLSFPLAPGPVDPGVKSPPRSSSRSQPERSWSPSSRASRRRGSGKSLEGEVIVSAETAARRAPDFAWSPHDELVLYLVHGLLHLAGYDDLNPAEKRIMRRRERAILSLWGLTPEYRRRGRKRAESVTGRGRSD